MLSLSLFIVITYSKKIVKEVSPREHTGKMIVLLCLGFLFGDGVSSLFSEILFENNNNGTFCLEVIFFLIPPALSLLQLILAFTVFKNDTPLFLHKELMEMDCSLELERMYPLEKRRTKEWDLIVETVNRTKIHVPSYHELFSKRYRRLIIQIGILTTFEAFIGLFFIRQSLTIVLPSNLFNIETITIFSSASILGALLLLILVDGRLYIIIIVIGRRVLLIIGTTSILVIKITTLIIVLAYSEVKWNIIIVGLTVEHLYFELSSGSLIMLYSIEVLSDRGYALMCLYYRILISIMYYILIFIEWKYASFRWTYIYLSITFTIATAFVKFYNHLVHSCYLYPCCRD